MKFMSKSHYTHRSELMTWQTEMLKRSQNPRWEIGFDDRASNTTAKMLCILALWGRC